MKNLLFLSILMFSSFIGVSQNVNELKPTDTIPIDPNLKIGKLANGFTYYIRKKNRIDKGELDIYFVVRAGSNQENQNQSGLAHLVEHLPFRGTVHFKKPNEYFQGRGLKIGKEINAHTGDYFTVYRLNNIKTEDEVTINSGLQFMRDIAQGQIFTRDVLESEKPIIKQELIRGGINEAPNKTRFQYMNDVIGSNNFKFMSTDLMLSVIDTFSLESVNKFYNFWYRPDFEAIIVEGNMDENYIKNKIEELFSDLIPSFFPRLSIEYGVLNWNNKVLGVICKEQKNIEIKLIMKHPYVLPTTMADYLLLLKQKLFSNIISNRLLQILRDTLHPFSSMGCVYLNDFNLSGPKFGAVQASIVVRDNLVKESFLEGMREIERFRRFGVSKIEFENGKKVFKELEYDFLEHKENTNFDDDIMNNYVLGAAYPSIEFEKTMLNQFLANLTLEEFNTFINTQIRDINRDLVFLLPEKYSSFMPSSQTVQEWIIESRSGTLKPYNALIVDKASKKEEMRELMTKQQISKMPVKKGKIKCIEYKSIGATKLVLFNGIEVILKPVKVNKGDKGRVYIRAINRARNVPVDVSDQPSALLCPVIAANSGLGKFTDNDVRSIFKAKSLLFTPYLSKDNFGIHGETVSSQIESLLQAFYLFFSQPKFEITAYEKVIQKLIKQQSDPLKGKSSYLLFALDSIERTTGISKQNKWLTSGEIDNISYEKANYYFKTLFGNAVDFSFIITGEFDISVISSLLSKYFGSFSVQSHIYTVPITTTKCKVVNGNFRKNVYDPNYDENGSLCIVNLRYYGCLERSLKANLELEVLGGGLLKILLNRRLREKEGGAYTVSSGYLKHNSCLSSVYLGFVTADVIVVDSMITAAKEELLKLKESEIDNELLNDAKGIVLNSIREKMMTNDFWIDYFSERISDNSALYDANNIESVINSISAYDILLSARKFIADDNHYEFVILPETAKN